jgi:acetolactate synthase-1/2/3 large subunit
MRTGSSEFIDALTEAGVSYIFANLGSDHTGIVEALAEAEAIGRPAPKLIICPTEMVALSAAHGFAQLTGVAQAVVVHVECGTQSLAGAIHNAAKGRIPVLIFAGMSPATQHGELTGSRNEFIHWIQDVFDQRGLVRGYVKYSHEFRTAENIREITHRAIRFATSDPKGPVYLVGAREVMEQQAKEHGPSTRGLSPLAPGALPPQAAAHIAAALARAHRPLIVTSYVGRNAEAVKALTKFANRLGIGVLESVPNYMNFDHRNPLYLGNQWNERQQNPALAEADVVLVIDSDVPWIPLINRPSDKAVVFHIDIDPLKQQMPMTAVTAAECFQADAATALNQLLSAIDDLGDHGAAVAERGAHYARLHDARVEVLRAKEDRSDDTLTPEGLTAVLRERIGPDAIVINEGISNYQTIFNHLAPAAVGSIFTSGGGSLGWNTGAAFGMKLARPDKTIVALTGDGSYMMSLPSSVYWMARRYNAPLLQVIYNNRGWKSPKLSALALHPSGYASKSDDIGVSFEPPPDYAGIAHAAGGALARTARTWRELDEALEAALRAVRMEGRSAVIDAWLPAL